MGLALATTACGGVTGGGASGAADCTSQIRSDGAVFTSYGSTDQSGSEHGVALEAVCEDGGQDARGSVFTDGSREVTTYRFPGHPPSEVLGVRHGGGSGYSFFVADSVSPDDRDRIQRELEKREP